MTRNDYFKQLVELLGAKHGDHNANALVSWAQAEGGAAWWNPLNTTMPMPGAWDYNWVHVKNYPNLAEGLQAISKTLRQTDPALGFDKILAHLRAGDPAKQTLEAVEASSWGTGGLALSVLPYVQKNYWQFANHPVAPTQ